MDKLNMEALKIIFKRENLLVKGLFDPILAAAIFQLKPIHIMGYKLTSNSQITEYWLRHKSADPVEYVRVNIHIFETLLKRKQKLYSENLLITLLSDH